MSESDFIGLEGVDAPMFRSVCQHTGDKVPVHLATAQVLLEEMAAQRDKANERADGLQAERDNLVASIPDTAAIRDFLKHALDRADEAEEQCGRYLDTIDELQDRLLRTETDLKVAQAGGVDAR